MSDAARPPEPAPPAWPADDPSLSWLPEGRRGLARAFVASFWLLPVAFYAWTACRGVGWVDSAMIVNNVFLLRVSSWVNSHNLFQYLARIWLVVAPIDPPAFSLNLLAGLFGAVTVYGMFRVGLQLTGNLAASTIGAVALMVSHSLWWHATLLEVYTLNTALIAAILWLVVRWNQTGRLPLLYGAVLCFGLGVSNHVLMGLFLFAFLTLFLLPWERRALWSPRVFGTGVLAFLLGAQLWMTKFEEDYVKTLNRDESHWADQTPAMEWSAFTDTLYRATGGKFQESMFPSEMSAEKAWRWRGNYLFLLVGNYPSVAFPVGLLGFWALWRDRRHRTTAVFFTVGLLAQVTWSMNYFIWDMYAFGLPVWVMFSLPVMLGFDQLLRRAGHLRTAVLGLAPSVLLAPLLYARIAVWAQSPGFWQDYFYGLGGQNLWNGAEFLANPNKRHYTRTEDVIASYAEVLPSGAHLWDSDGKGYYPFRMYFQRVMGGRPDVHSHLIFNAFIEPEKAAEHAKVLQQQLQRGESVWVSSLGRPERMVLAQLHRSLAGPSAPDLKALSRMSAEEFAETFPRYGFRKVDLPYAPGAYIFEIVPRE